MSCELEARNISYLHQGNIGVSRNSATVALSDLGLCLAEVLAGSVEGSVRHFGCECVLRCGLVNRVL